MAKTILDLFKSREKEVYGNEGSKILIDSRGIINTPRTAALLATSPTAIGSLIGNEVGGTLKGTANRPSDTIFRSKGFLSKPISLIPGPEDGIDPHESYFVKKSPGPPSFVAKFKQGTTNPKEELIKQTGQLLKNPVGTLNKFKDLTGKLKKNSDTATNYGAKFSEDINGVVFKEDIKFSEYAPVYSSTTDGNKNTNWQRTGVKKRNDGFLEGKSPVYRAIEAILLNKAEESANKTLIDKTDIPYVLISSYPNEQDKIYLPGTISGISEDFSPEWNNYKYLGSPFNLYRYGGVERTIKFQLKLYYVDNDTKQVMLKNLNKLKELVFPNKNTSAALYPDNGGYSPLSFTPNILFLTINGIYKKIPCVMESLGITIPDDVPWASMNPEQNGKTPEEISSKRIRKKQKYPTITEEKNSFTPPKQQIIDLDDNTAPYPIMIEIDMGFKIIETLALNIFDQKYEYGTNGDYFVNPESAIGQATTRIPIENQPLKNKKSSVLFDSNAIAPGQPVKLQ